MFFRFYCWGGGVVVVTGSFKKNENFLKNFSKKVLRFWKSWYLCSRLKKSKKKTFEAKPKRKVFQKRKVKHYIRY